MKPDIYIISNVIEDKEYNEVVLSFTSLKTGYTHLCGFCAKTYYYWNLYNNLSTILGAQVEAYIAPDNLPIITKIL